MQWQFPYASTRMPVLARNCVATTQPLAAQAGLSMLARGGSAVDAALATAIALTVLEPTSNGLGSDAFAIVWDGKGLQGLNASGRAPAGWTPDRFAGLDAMPPIGWDTVTVPGAVSAWVALHERYGRLPFEVLFEPAIRYARDGFRVTPYIAWHWGNQSGRLRDQPGFAETFLPGGRAPNAGEAFRAPAQAASLELIARTKGEAFYRGRLAEAIAAAAAKDGGAMTLTDLAGHRCDWVTPLGVDFKGYRIHELPPNGQGLAALIALGVLDRLDIDGLDPDGDEIHHLEIEATKLGIADVRAHVGDPAAMAFKGEDFLTSDYLDQRAKLVRRDRATAPNPGQPKEHGTVYLTAADSDGMMVSYIQSNYRNFGSGVVVPGTGISLHNRGNGFVLEPGHPNRVGPGKRPMNTIIPAFATKDGKPVAAFGVMGGAMQPQGHVQVAVRMFAKDQNPQAAIDAARWCVQDDTVLIEAAWPAETRSGLTARGHRLVETGPSEFGAAQVIYRLGDDAYVAASESRRDGQAVGF